MTDGDWARTAPWLDDALAHCGRTHALSDVRALLDAGEAQLWPGRSAALVTIVENDPAERRLLIWLGGGDLTEIVRALVPRAETWAAGQGCRRVLIVGRPGWERVLAPQGYAPVARIIAKEL